MIRVGLIGCGDHCSKSHAKVLSENKNVEIRAISECIFPEELSQRQQQFRIPYAFPSFMDMLRSVELDAVVISTPHTQHFLQARCCLESGLHVLVDKPPACRLEEIKALVSLADSSGHHLLVASQRRYDPLFCHLRDTVRDGELGELKFAEFHYGRSKRRCFTSSWRNDPALSGGGVLLDAGYHMLDILLWITGRRPQRVFGILSKLGARVETSASLTLELEEGISANLSIHLEMPPHMVREEIGLFGSRGSLLYENASLPGNVAPARMIKLRTGHQGDEVVQRQRSEEIDQAPAIDFINAILEQKPVRSSGRESIETIRAIEWIYNELNAKGYLKDKYP
jgi:predicted dehydrogenase